MIAYVCGGTGGHVYPAIALAQQKEDGEFFFITSKTREDKRIVADYGYPKEEIAIGPLGVLKAVMLLNKKKVTTLVSTGGGFTFPFVVAAFLMRLELILMEQNVLPGRVVRTCAWMANKVCLSFEETKKYLNGKNVEVTGNPVRTVFKDDAFTADFKRQEFSDDKPKIVVFGGSQGAHAINDFFVRHQEELSEYSIVLITGASYAKSPQSKTDFLVYPYFERMDLLYNWADVVVSRSGATTLAELFHFKKKAILVPYPHAKDNHQELNADVMVAKEMAVKVHQFELRLNNLLHALAQLLS